MSALTEDKIAIFLFQIFKSFFELMFEGIDTVKWKTSNNIKMSKRCDQREKFLTVLLREILMLK